MITQTTKSVNAFFSRFRTLNAKPENPGVFKAVQVFHPLPRFLEVCPDFFASAQKSVWLWIIGALFHIGTQAMIPEDRIESAIRISWSGGIDMNALTNEFEMLLHVVKSFQ